MGTVALRLTGAAKSYDRDGSGHAAFENIDLEVRQGEVFALLGPTGCGKSSLLRVIAGLETLTTGRVEVAGEGQADERPRVGMVFQDPLLLPWLTVAENVGLGLNYRANHDAREAGAVDALLRDFGLADLGNASPAALSGGQAQRVSLARTIVIRPRILLLDEPFGALDPRTRASLQDWLLEVVHRRRLTTIVVTHDVEEALRLGDRVGLMSRRPGTIASIWERGQAGRDEILASYQSAVPEGAGAPNWVI